LIASSVNSARFAEDENHLSFSANLNIAKIPGCRRHIAAKNLATFSDLRTRVFILHQLLLSFYLRFARRPVKFRALTQCLIAMFPIESSWCPMSSLILILVALVFCYAIAWHDRSATSSPIVVRKNERPQQKPGTVTSIHGGG
jgi:hypothetical protein